MATKTYEERKEQAQEVCAMLKPQYETRIYLFDPTAVAVIGINYEQHCDLCAKLHCSGSYSEITHTGFILNFGKYE